MNNGDARLAASVLYGAATRNKTAEDAEGRGGTVKQPLRTSAVNNKEDQPQRTQRSQRVVVSLCVLCALCGFPNPIPKDNKKVSETSSNQIKHT